jgi:predicted acylesterase/phospholipase RssA
MYNGKCAAAEGTPAPEVFCGTGAGAFNAAVIASRLPGQFPSPVEYLESLWADEIPREGRMRNNRVYRKRLDTLQFFDIPFMWRRPLKSWVLYFGDLGLLLPELASRTMKALFQGNFSTWLDLSIWREISPMQRLISESVNLGVIRDGESGSGPARVLRVVATEKGTGRPHIFKNSDFTEEIGHKAILASCALPIIFPTVDIQGREFFYGGLVMQTPLQPAIDAGCTVIHLIHNEPRIEQRLGGEASNTMEMLNRTVAVALSATLERDLESRRRINSMLDGFSRAQRQTNIDMRQHIPEAAEYKRVVVHQHRPKTVLGGSGGLLNFSRENIEAAISAGESDAAQHNCVENGCIL